MNRRDSILRFAEEHIVLTDKDTYIVNKKKLLRMYNEFCYINELPFITHYGVFTREMVRYLNVKHDKRYFKGMRLKHDYLLVI